MMKFQNLIHACGAGDVAAVELLLKRGANVNEDEGTPLFNAIVNGHVKICELLADNGATFEYDLDLYLELWIENICPPLQSLFEKHIPPEKLREVELLEEKREGIEKLYKAASHNNVKVIKNLLKSVNVNDIYRKYSSTPLHVAVSCRHPDSVKLLLEGGANINVINSRGQTPVDISQEDMKLILNNETINEKIKIINEMLKNKRKAAVS